MNKPDVVFNVRVCPVFYVTGCATKQTEESRGLFGFHSYRTCPDCKVFAKGFELWSNDNYCQGVAIDRRMLQYVIKRLARKQWRMRDGRMMGYHFANGGPLFYTAR